MLRLISATVALFLLVTGLSAQAAKPGSSDQSAIVITFKDGHQQTFSLADVARIEFKNTAAAAVAATPSRASAASFAGRWKVSTGPGNATFYITLDPDGKASKSIGSTHGKWTMFGNEARISWDDGWHDVIRKAGNHYEKAAYAPGKSYSDEPSNITGATNTEPL